MEQVCLDDMYIEYSMLKEGRVTGCHKIRSCL